jgi:hypothetical protein
MPRCRRHYAMRRHWRQCDHWSIGFEEVGELIADLD